MNESVIRPWMNGLTWKEQSAIFTAIRGSDNHENESLKNLIRWLRRQVFYDADIDGTFIKANKMVTYKEFKPMLEYETLHFVSHLFHAIQILSERHPDEYVRDMSRMYYEAFCEMLHCAPESYIKFSERLKDNRENIDRLLY